MSAPGAGAAEEAPPPLVVDVIRDDETRVVILQLGIRAEDVGAASFAGSLAPEYAIALGRALVREGEWLATHRGNLVVAKGKVKLVR